MQSRSYLQRLRRPITLLLLLLVVALAILRMATAMRDSPARRAALVVPPASR